ncbi:MAG: nitrate/sulfonate/bicarbonate ABC transporter ATP-binding protein [Rhizobiales bacterium 68-8]|nr:MAG: nitrate/sulfonate/bicarbonate ABC transporter ATP-binding protein [Rhizobiales bacterium 68-8]
MTQFAAADRAGGKSMPEIAMSARGVSHAYGVPGSASHVATLDDVSLDVRRGELLALIGPSGCGKTTLLNMFASLVRPLRGTIEVDGQPVTGPMPRKVAFVFQEHALFPGNTIRDNIGLALKFQGVAKPEAAERAAHALEAVGLADFADHFPGQLSGGMKQRASLARALSLDTEFILMDEPFAALDEQTRIVLGEDLSALLSRTRKTIVFVTHSLGEAVLLADRVAIFSARPGRITGIIDIDEPHPRRSQFATSEKFNRLRGDIFGLLHDEIRKSIDDSVHRRSGAAA